jgi:hypothetical protein
MIRTRNGLASLILEELIRREAALRDKRARAQSLAGRKHHSSRRSD